MVVSFIGGGNWSIQRENHRPVASYRQTLSHNVALSTPCHERCYELTTIVVIGNDFTGSCKSNYHTCMITTALFGNTCRWGDNSQNKFQPLFCGKDCSV